VRVALGSARVSRYEAGGCLISLPEVQLLSFSPAIPCHSRASRLTFFSPLYGGLIARGSRNTDDNTRAR